MSGLNPILERMAALVGIAPSYTDAFGRSVDTSIETRQALLAGFGLNVQTESEAQESLAALERLKTAIIPSLVAVEAGLKARLRLRQASARTVWHLTEESGTPHEGFLAAKDAFLEIPPLPVGYHDLRIGDTKATVIAAPRRCWEPDVLQDGAQLWGAAAQIYSLRSERDFGIGDYGDIAMAVEGVAKLGGAFLGLSPVHALFSADRSKISPYSPSSRLFLETIYIDPTAVAGFDESDAARLLEQVEIGGRLAQLREAALIDHAAVWELKRPLLEALWSHHKKHGDHSAFQAFRRVGGEALEAHATFEALSESFRAEGRWWLGEWPEPYRSIDSDEVRRFQAEQAQRVDFHAWLQWIADQQLGAAAKQARDAGMPIGLYRDLAVGADGGGSEVWATPQRYAPTLSIGAPPDPLGPQGQNWGLPPFNPLTLETEGLAAFRSLVSANMRHAGAIRIDHAFQLSRLFLIPSGAPAAQGAYVDYPFEAMLAVLRVESHRAQCLVIAEDLGTAPEGFSDAIMDSGVLSYRVLPFEREQAAFKRPGDYPRSALAVITTHDLPTFVGWWRGLDIDLRQTFGVFDPETAASERATRAADRRHFAEALAEEELLSAPEAPDTPPLEGAVRYLARTASALTALQLEDASGELNQANMPGLDAGHPNWRRRLSTTIEAMTAPGSMFAKLAAALAEEGRDVRRRRNALASPPPRATYRLQFHKDFTFDDAARIVPYLAKLGVSHVYSSPIQAASPGSTHGYDIVDHTVINPELGGEDGFRRLSDALRAHGLSLLLDIVPNHMGVGGGGNPWWLSVLEWGRLSPFADAFDVDWERSGAHGKLIAPVLGDLYGTALEKGDLKMTFDPNEGSFSIWHWEHRFPICPISYPVILDYALATMDERARSGRAFTLAERFRALRTESSHIHRTSLPKEAEGLKHELATAAASLPAFRKAIESAVAFINGVPDVPMSFDTLHRVLEEQAYRLAYWRVASSDINYRRFFDINNLAGLRVEIPEIFEKSHELIFRLAAEGRIQGVRIDHIDGLADPKGYTRALQGKLGPGFYVVVEKILEPGEELRNWPVAGTTGYDTLNLIDGVLVDTRTGEEFERLYREFSGLQGSYETLLKQAKIEITEKSFASELGVLVSDLKQIADADLRTRDYTTLALRQALVDTISAFPVYRSYIDTGEPASEDIELIETTVRAAKRCSSLPDHTVHDFIAATLLGQLGKGGAGRLEDSLRRFRRHFQQLTGPVMAKSLEDTLFYRYGRLIALNEVGGDPGHFGVSVAEFHEANGSRAKKWPNAMIATATHDTKRGEDARSRLLALSELPREWEETLALWREVVAPSLTATDDAQAPDTNDQIILLQALLGAWPLELLDEENDQSLSAFRERMEGYVIKALREAKRHTSWINPKETYEGAALDLLRTLLAPGSDFLERFRPSARRLAFLGVLNSLSRTILKATLPGVPDIYQGTEFWDFSLVDPDNRRPVDYETRAKALNRDDPLEALTASWPDGRIKQRVLASLLQDRAEAPALYAEGDYQPLAVHGLRSEHLIAFSRRRGSETLVVVVPRLWAGLVPHHRLPLEGTIWGDTTITLPRGLWRDIVTGQQVTIEGSHPTAASLLAEWPFAVLRNTNLGKNR